MKNILSQKSKQTFLLLLISIVLLSISGFPQEEHKTVLGLNVDFNKILINTSHDRLIKERFSIDKGLLAQTEEGKAALQWAKELLQEQTTIPPTPYTLYREYKRTGDRKKYEQPYFLKRSMLSATTLLIYFENDDSLLPLLNDLIWNICEETSWVLPAHERQEKYTYVDLFSAETATQLAHTFLFLEDKLPDEIKKRIRYEVKRRVMQPYLFYSENKYGWVSGRNNWTGVCAGSIGECFIILEENEQILRKAITLVTNQLARFLKNGFAEDGGCLEGISYWNYGLTHYVSFGELLYEATDGNVNIMQNPRLYQIAFYPYVVYLGNGQFASFSDAPSQFYPHAFITHRLAERFSAYDRLSSTSHPFIYHKLGKRLNVDYLHALANPSPIHWHFGDIIRNILWSYPYSQQAKQEIPIKSTCLPKSGIARFVSKDNHGNTHIVICKAGSNNEPHNHNDVGSFVYAVNNTIFLTDPGAGLYSREYFSAKRYENIFTNSYGHSLPVIGGKLQSTGEQYKGELIYEEPNKAIINFHEAYNIPTLKKAQRTLLLNENGLKITDIFEFSNQGEEVEEALVTWLPVSIQGNCAIIESKEGKITITPSCGSFEVESLKKQCEENSRSGELSRIRLKLPTQTKTQITFNITFLK
ncbi:MAG: heparinase II/III domain-containing protein [Candidatus Hydrogenedens sp.]